MSKWKKWEIEASSLIIGGIIIGKGGFGEVYRGKLYGSECAVKQIKLSQENSIEKIHHEIGIMGDVHHPNLVCLLGMCKKEDFVYIITEYIDQGCLRDYLARNTCTESMIIKFSKDITRGMAWIHSRKPPIFHRDLHTRNILVSSSGSLKLCDFGLSLVKGEVFSSNSLYKRIIPPELQATRDFSGYSAPSDVFMFGLVLFELITKQKATNQITLGNLDDIRQRSGSTTRKLLNLVQECISEDPSKRPTFQLIITILETIEEEHGDNSSGDDKSDIPLQYVIDIGYT
jgi:serine/threonine-protein kinase CTR1